jgi:hypothetical protein
MVAMRDSKPATSARGKTPQGLHEMLSLRRGGEAGFDQIALDLSQNQVAPIRAVEAMLRGAQQRIAQGGRNQDA